MIAQLVVPCSVEHWSFLEGTTMDFFVSRKALVVAWSIFFLASAFAVVEDGLVAHYDLSDDFSDPGFLDSGPNALHGSCSSGNCPVFDANGGVRQGGTYVFDGSTQFIEVADHDALDLTGDFSVAFWVKWDEAQSQNQWQAILLKGDGDAVRNYSVYLNQGSINVSWFDGQWWQLISSPQNAIASDGSWHHVAYVREASVGFESIMVDGVIVYNGGIASDVVPNYFPLYIGGNPVYPEERFAGRLNDVQIYNRALTLGEIQLIMDLPRCGDGIIQSPNHIGLFEVCDGANLNGESCQSMGFTEGSLLCHWTCSAFATQTCSGFPATYFIDGNPVVNNSSQDVNQSFVYSVVLSNLSNKDVLFSVSHRVPSGLVPVSSNLPVSIVSSGAETEFVLGPVSVPANTDFSVDFGLERDSNSVQTDFLVKTIVSDLNRLRTDEFQSTVMISDSPAIPEFDFLLIPVLVVLASFFVIRKA